MRLAGLGIGLAVLVVVGVVFLAVAYRILKAAHTRPPEGADGHPHSHTRGGMDGMVLKILTAAIRFSLRLGLRVGPMMMLTVVGRKSGMARTNPVDLFERDGSHWLVATHESNPNWVQNLRVAGGGELSLGRKRYTFTAVELADEEAGAVLKEVLGPRLRRRFAGVVLRQTLVISPDASLPEFIEAAELHPVFEVKVTQVRKGGAHQSRPKIAIAVGLLVASIHLVLGLADVMTETQWIGGIVLGLLVAGLGNHARVFGHR